MVLVPLRYAWARAAGPLSAALSEVSSGKAAFADAFARAWDEVQRSKLTSVLRLKGAAMAPTFNDGADSRGEVLLVRNLPHPTPRRVARDVSVRALSDAPPVRAQNRLSGRRRCAAQPFAAARAAGAPRHSAGGRRDGLGPAGR